MLAGSLAFDVLDRLLGQWTVVDTFWMEGFVDVMLKNAPAVWFVLNLVRATSALLCPTEAAACSPVGVW